MINILEVESRLIVSGFFLLLVIVVGCYDPVIPEEQITTKPSIKIYENSKTLYLDVRFDGESYNIVKAIIHDSTYTSLPIIKIYGIYGVQVMTENYDLIWDQYSWMKPINKSITLPFSDDTAYFEFVHRREGGKFIVSSFSKEEIIFALDY